MLATAPGNGFCFGNLHFFRLQPRAFMRAVAKRLAL